MCQSGVDERVHTYSLTYGQSIICFYMMGLGANFTMKEVASSANSHASCHYDICSVRKNVCMFLKKGGILRRMEVKNKGADTPFRTMYKFFSKQTKLRIKEGF